MGALTKDTPKPMLCMGEKTLLERNLAAMPDAIDEVVIVVGYLADTIKNFLGDRFGGKKITYVHQAELKGTGHALSLCKDVLHPVRGRAPQGGRSRTFGKAASNGVHDRFLVINGDDLYAKADLERLAREPLGILVWELAENDPEGRQASVKLNGGGKLADIVERQPAVKGALVNTGAYVLDERYFKYPLVPANNLTAEFGLPQTMLQMVKGGAEMSVVKATWWHKVASPKDLELLNKK